MTLRDILNKIIWDPQEQRSHFELVYIHRGVPMDKKTISCSLIEKVGSSRFTYQSAEEGEVFIPFHRILEIRNVKTGQLLWMKIRQR
ncbi:MAG: RNA repair domain-containing protein [Candidatus Bathyarchaeota archaeon]